MVKTEMIWLLHRTSQVLGCCDLAARRLYYQSFYPFIAAFLEPRTHQHAYCQEGGGRAVDNTRHQMFTSLCWWCFCWISVDFPRLGWLVESDWLIDFDGVGTLGVRVSREQEGHYWTDLSTRAVRLRPHLHLIRHHKNWPRSQQRRLSEASPSHPIFTHIIF